MAVAGLILVTVTQLIMPGVKGGSRGTPMAIIFSGLLVGSVIAVFATGIVLIYRTLRIINFAVGPLGAVGAVLMVQLVAFTPVPFPLALLLGLLLCAALGAIVGVIMLRFFNSPRLFLTVVTIVGSATLLSALTFVARLPFFPDPNKLTDDETFRATREGFIGLLPFRGFKFNVGSFDLKFGFEHLFALEICAIAILGVVVFLRFTRAGTAVRALAENPERASLLGISVGSLSIIVWVIAGLLDGVGAVASFTGAPGVGSGFAALLAPLAAAVIGRFHRIGTTVFAALFLGIGKTAFDFSYPKGAGLYNLFLFAALAAGLLLQRKQMGRSETGAATSWAATSEPRPMPKELRQVTGLRVARLVLILTGLFFVALFPWVASTNRILLAGVVMVNAIAVLSLVVLTGWAGQVSMGQFAFVAVGSVVGGYLTSKRGIPFWFALPMVSAVCAGLAALVGLPALRIKGLFLLATTFAFAIAVQSVLFDENYFKWLLPERVERPTLFFLNFEDEKSMYYLVLAALVLSIVVVLNLRRSRVGRTLIALRDNEANVQSFGINAVRAKLMAFAVAGALAGFAGCVFAAQQRGVSAGSFTANSSVQVFVMAVVGGVSSPGGALLGSAYIQIPQQLASNNAILLAFIGGLGPLGILFLAPGGLVSLINQGRDSVLRIVAQRRRIVVPSLFADYDPDALARQLIPLAEASTQSGLAVLAPGQRFALASELYQGRGERIIDKLGPTKQAKEAQLIGAAAASLAEIDVESVAPTNGEALDVPALTEAAK